MRIVTVFKTAAYAALLLLMGSPATVQANSDGPGAKVLDSGKDRDGSHDFDFLVGTWKMHHRRLRNPLTGSQTWAEFDGTLVNKPLWNGRANEDEVVFNDPSGRIDGIAVRFYNPQAHQWSIYWASNTTGGLALPATVGQFDVKNGRGEFYDQESRNGRLILVRFLWFDIKPDFCRWEQAFSDDGGKTWETNWSETLERER